jgi:nitrite transporter NirC
VEETIDRVNASAQAKAGALGKSVLRYFTSSMLAGVYVGFGIALIFAIGAPLQAAGSPAVKALMGASFAVALTLVIFAGSELFTGNNMVMTIGSMSGVVSWSQTLAVWLVSFLGNLVGSLGFAALTVVAGTVTRSPVKDFVASVAAAKMSASFSELFARGILCNTLVCLAVWMAMRAKDETAKLICIFWCLFAFIGAGFEHSVANMSLLGMSLLVPHDPARLSWAGFVHNLVPVTLGNVVGGAIVVGAAYFFIAGERRPAVALVAEPRSARAERGR